MELSVYGASQAASASSPQTVSSQAVITNSVPQAGSFWKENTAQAAGTSSPQTVSSQAVITNSQGVSAVQAGNPGNAGSQATSTPQAGNSWAAPLPWQSAPSPKEIALYPHRQVAMTLTLRKLVLFPLKQIVPGQRALMPKQAGLLPKQSALTVRELVLLPQASKANRQSNSANSPQGSPRGNSLEDPNPKWVINLPSKLLTQAQRSVLAKGPNFAVTPIYPPNLEYIMAIESVCTKLGQ